MPIEDGELGFGGLCVSDEELLDLDAHSGNWEIRLRTEEGWGMEVWLLDRLGWGFEFYRCNLIMISVIFQGDWANLGTSGGFSSYRFYVG